MPQKLSNNARSLLTSSITAGSTSFTVESAKADRFPVGNTTSFATPADWFKVTVFDAAGNFEVIYVGTRAGGSNTMSVLLRGQEGTTAQAFAAGSFVQLGITAQDVQNALAGSFPSLAVSGPAAFAAAGMTQGGVAARLTPVGGIIMWSGAVAAIPAGWALCDGTNGTPNLRDKFIVGAGTDLASVSQTNITGAQTKTGGNKDLIVPSHTHTAAFIGDQLPGHNHSINDPGHAHTGGFAAAQNNTAGSIPPYAGNSTNTGASGTGISINATSAGTPSGSVAVGATGSSATNANLPPYYALAFIMCLG